MGRYVYNSLTEPKSKLYTYRVKEVVRVIDGDTVDVLIDMGFNITVKKRIRLKGIDTDELRGGTVDTKAKAKRAKSELYALLDMGDVYLRTFKDKTGKYGRLLGDFYVKNPLQPTIDVTKTLLLRGYAKKPKTKDL